MFAGFRAKARGFSHLADNKPCQDSVCFKPLSQEGCGIAVCADGHGSEKHFRSERGSRFAARIARDVMSEFYTECSHKLNKFKNISDILFDESLKSIEGSIIDEWRRAVIKDIKEKVFNETEKVLCEKHNLKTEDDLVSIYGTTLLAVLVTPHYWCALQLGDGAAALIKNEKEARILDELLDESLGFGRTTSLCASDAGEHFKHVYHVYKQNEKQIAGIIVATDGVVDSFVPQKYLEFTLNMRKEFLQNKEAAQKNLEEFLPKLSEQGSKDDVGIAGVFYGEERKC